MSSENAVLVVAVVLVAGAAVAGLSFAFIKGLRTLDALREKRFRDAHPHVAGPSPAATRLAPSLTPTGTRTLLPCTLGGTHEQLLHDAFHIFVSVANSGSLDQARGLARLGAKMLTAYAKTRPT